MATRTSGTVTKALDILDLFLDYTEGLTVTQISNTTGFNKSTVVRLCATLDGRGYLRRDPRGVYFIGPQIDRLSQIFRNQFSLEELIRPLLVRLRDTTGESTSFYIMDNDARVCLYREDSHHRIRHVVEEGARLPFKEGVVGRVLLAFSGAKGAEYKKIRADGYLDAEGRETFTASVSVPVLTQSNTLIGALVVSGLANRFDEQKRSETLLLLQEMATDLKEHFPTKDLKSA
jgi:DNA-binding IclR family transcriptional regulator